MSAAGKQAFLDAIKNGKGYVGTHSASDTFHSNESGGGNDPDRSGRYKNYGDAADPYVQMLGGELTITSELGEGTSVRVALPPECLAAGTNGDDVDVTAA